MACIRYCGCGSWARLGAGSSVGSGCVDVHVVTYQYIFFIHFHWC